MIMEGASKYYSVVTDTGNNMMAALLAAGEKLSITEIAAGDGGGAYYQPDPEMTSLKNELWRGPIDSCEISTSSDNILVVKGIIPGEVGGFTIREMAIFAEGGEMIAIANTPSTPKVNIVDGIINEMSLAIEIALLNGSVINLQVDPHIVTATKADIEMVKNEIYIALEERVNIVVAHENIPVDERKAHTFYLVVTGAGGESGNETIKAGPNMGLKIIERGNGDGIK